MKNEETHIRYYLKLKYLVPLCDTSSAYFCYDTPLTSDHESLKSQW